MGARNAFIYNVDPSKILFLEGNAVDILSRYKDGILSKAIIKSSEKATENDQEEICNGYIITVCNALRNNIDCVFLSPPWGGMDYLKAGKSGYELSKCIRVRGLGGTDYDGNKLLSLASNASKNKKVVYFLPKNINGFHIGKSAWNAGYRNGIELEQNVLNGKLKTVTVYLTNFCARTSKQDKKDHGDKVD
eukprot:304437_1